MSPPKKDQPSRPFLVSKNHLSRDLQEFRIDRQARNLTPKTIGWYEQSLGVFSDFLRSRSIETGQGVTPSVLRRFLLYLKERRHNPGGVRNIYGAAKAFLNWYADENVPPNWTNPIRKAHPPKRPEEPLEPVPLKNLKVMLATCKSKTLTSDRDQAILLALLDSGCRASEFLSLNVGDVNLYTGAVLVRKGKGRMFCTTFLGAKSRRALMRFEAAQQASRRPGRLQRFHERVTRKQGPKAAHVACARSRRRAEPRDHTPPNGARPRPLMSRRGFQAMPKSPCLGGLGSPGLGFAEAWRESTPIRPRPVK